MSTPARHAQRMFVAWWYGIALSSLVTALNLALYLADALPRWGYQATSQVGLLAISVALWGLLSYLVYLYTGSPTAHRWIGAAYIAFYLLLVALLAYYGLPDRIADNGWNLQAQYLQEDGTYEEIRFSTPALVAILLVLIGPQLGAALAYARLYRRAQDRTQRYRIALVAGSITLWFGTSLVAGSVGAEGVAWNLASRLLSMLAALAILIAYFPPRPWRRRWGLRSLGEETAGGGSTGT